MRKGIAFIFAMICFQWGNGQLYDKNWIIGGYAEILHFESDTSTKIDTFTSYINAYTNWACISDSNGELAFFSNGLQVYNRLGQVMPGGEVLSDSAVTAYFSITNGGLPSQQNYIAVPLGNNKYYLFSFSISDDRWSTDLYDWVHPNRLYYSIIDMSANNGLGTVTSCKNLILQTDFGDNRMTACRHANGRDWWLVVHGYDNNAYYNFLVTAGGISNPIIQNIGNPFQEPDAIGQAVFSPDGSKYASCTGASLTSLVLLDFDRCSGLFNNPVNIPLTVDTVINQGDTTMTAQVLGLYFSPSGQYLYRNSYQDLFQYDVQAADIYHSRKAIFGWNDSLYCCQKWLFMGFLAPNNRIYICPWNGTGPNYYHVIYDPDSAGASCNFKPSAFAGYGYNGGALSNVMNWRLGALIGSSCDTLNLGINSEMPDTKRIQIFPNPALTKVTIETREYLKNSVLSVHDVLGRLIYNNLNFYLEEELDISGWSNGVYFVEIGNGNRKFIGKLVKD